MGAPDEILRLVERFEGDKGNYVRAVYKETQVRVDFVDPFFKALGWDVSNVAGMPNDLRDVVVEETLAWEMEEEVGEGEVKVREKLASRHPDYTFRVDGKRKFFVEAKKPSRNLREDAGHAYQVRSYGWSAKLPVSILTDFQEMAIYDCRVRPQVGDAAGVALLPDMYLTFEEYGDRWDEIAGLFSREAVAGGSLDRFIEQKKALRGTVTVDAAFLKEISQWREALAQDIAERNGQLGQHDLNYAVQMTINRIIFLRICEDRGIEPEDQLRLTLKYGGGMYKRLGELFRRADERYNSGLFHFRQEKDRAEHIDSFTLDMEVGDEAVGKIIESLYYPHPYKFDVIPIEILGQVYEQFLGKVIRIDEQLNGVQEVRVEDKPEVRKAGGVYYTPTYIVEYIVGQTVGALLEGRTNRQDAEGIVEPQRRKGAEVDGRGFEGGRRMTPEEVSGLRILDPACGSGSFLIGAYGYLLDWHLRWYTENGPEGFERTGRRKKGAVERVAGRGQKAVGGRQGGEGQKAVGGRQGGEGAGEGATWRLTIEERKRILRNNIYGVDIDTQAVEVTKLSLLLKVLEGESEHTLGQQGRLFGLERVLPDLGENIKAGNSLIGPDFYESGQASFLDEEEARRINVFDWERGFPEVMKGGGFDAVIGNPPYIRIQAMKEWAPIEVEHYKRRYVSASKGNYDIYVVFVEKGLSLLNQNGVLGYILPHKFFNALYGEPLRHLISNGRHLSHVVHFGDEQVFAGAMTYTTLIFLNRYAQDVAHIIKVDDLAAWRSTGSAVDGNILTSNISAGDWNFIVGRDAGLFSKLAQLPTKLSDISEKIFQGLVTSADAVYFLDPLGPESGGIVPVASKATGKSYELEAEVVKPLCKGSRDVRRYSAAPSKRVVFPYDAEASARAGKTVLIPHKVFAQQFPRTWAYLQENSMFLRGREKGKMRHAGWYGYVYPKSVSLFAKPKILTPSIAANASYTLDLNGEFYFVGSGGGGGGGYGIILLPSTSLAYEYVLGLLNSKLLDYFIKRTSSQFSGGYYAYNRQYIEQLPIRTINFDDPTDKKKHDRMVELVEGMLELHKRLAEAKSPYEKDIVGRQIEATDGQIDRLVYELYGLSEEEVRVVEA